MRTLSRWVWLVPWLGLGCVPDGASAPDPSMAVAPEVPLPNVKSVASGPGSGLRTIELPVEQQRSGADWGAVLTDIANHLPSRYGRTYDDADRVTFGHETSHGIHSHIRNTRNDTGQRANGFYLLDGRAALVIEPPIRKSQVAAFVPQGLRGSRFGTYVTGQTAWDDTPLYIWDEWVAYINGSAVAVDLHDAGGWRWGQRDAVEGTLEFTTYGFAVAMAVEQQAPEHFAQATQLKEALAYFTRRALSLYRRGSTMPPFRRASQEATYRELTEGAAGAPIRAFSERIFGAEWTREVLLGIEDAPPQTTPPETMPPQTPPETTPPETTPPETTPPETTPPETTPPSGDQCTDGPNKLPPPRATVYYGTRAPSHVRLEADQITAVVAIGFGSPRSIGCSGTLISDRIVLTAKHCTTGRSGSSMYAVFGEQPSNPLLSLRTLRKLEHPSSDLALLELERAPADSISVRPIPITADDLDDGDLNGQLEQAGYGQTERGSGRGRFFVAEKLVAYTAGGRNLMVDGEGQRGVCFGDSGGPSMIVSDAGDTRVVGALHGGDSSCVGRDEYARVDRERRAWVEQWAGPTPGPGAAPCGTTTPEGACSRDGREASWCAEDGTLRKVACGSGEVCGWSPAQSGWRCIPEVVDPCAGLGAFGRCDGDALSWCESGAVRTRSCGLCGEACVLVDDAFGFACVAGAVDSDGDRIADDRDLCSGTPAGARVWTAGDWLGCAAGQRRDREQPPPPTTNPQPQPPTNPQPPPTNPQPSPNADADGDGVPDADDLCGRTPAGQRVWTWGEWLGCAGGERRDRRPPIQGADTDGDGIADADDLCSGTPRGADIWPSGPWMGCAGGQRRDR